MLVIHAFKHSPSQILLQFCGGATHVEVARSILEQVPDTQWIDIPRSGLIIRVSPALLDAIHTLSQIQSIDGEPFAPLFLPYFGLVEA